MVRERANTYEGDEEAPPPESVQAYPAGQPATVELESELR